MIVQHVYLCNMHTMCTVIMTLIMLVLFISLSLYIYIRAYMCTYVYMYTYVYVYIYICMYVCIYIYIYICIYIYIYIYIYTPHTRWGRDKWGSPIRTEPSWKRARWEPSPIGYEPCVPAYAMVSAAHALIELAAESINIQIKFILTNACWQLYNIELCDITLYNTQTCIVALIAQWLGCQPHEAEVLGSILTTSNWAG